MSEYQNASIRATQFEGEELEPDWEWAREHFAKSVRQAVLDEYATNGEEPPSWAQVSKIANLAADVRLREVQE